MEIEDVKSAWNAQADDANNWDNLDADERVEFALLFIEEAICNLIAEWEVDNSVLDNEHVTTHDRTIGQTLKKCASELRSIIGA